MVLTAQQEAGLKTAIQRYKDNERDTVIAGYAGSGKSELVKFIIAALADYGIDSENDVVYTAFSGKATQVLAKKGNHNTSTLHKLLYDHYPTATGGFIRRPKNFIPYKIVVLDEVSMVPLELINLLFSHKTHVICLGDPEQLPPVGESDNNHLLDHPHIFLSEIMRQEKDSEIINLSMDIREKKTVNYCHSEDIMVLHPNELSTGMLLWADQVIVGTNKMRHEINSKIRQLKGYEEPIVNGEKIICLRNYWDIISNKENALVNGSMGTLQNPFSTKIYLPQQIKYYASAPEYFDVICGNFKTETEDLYKNLNLDQKLMLENESCCDWKLAYKLNKISQKTNIHYIPLDFVYGYAITGWKAQGSEWDKVLIIEEGHPFKSDEHRKFLYTCVTRATKKVVLIRKE